LIDTHTIDYLKELSIQHPNFSTIPGWQCQIVAENCEHKLSQLVNLLPSTIDDGPSIFGHALQVNGNHRTLFIIDREHRTVEYYNSFGSDSVAKKPMNKLVQLLSAKYQLPFTYEHKTENCCLQPDSYQCGVWPCKLTEERLKQGKNFNPRGCRNFDIAAYRKPFYAQVYVHHVYSRIGLIKLYDYIKQISTDPDHHCWDPVFSYLDHKGASLCRIWGETGEVPEKIKSMCASVLATL
jgi:hypothetical protein